MPCDFKLAECVVLIALTFLISVSDYPLGFAHKPKRTLDAVTPPNQKITEILDTLAKSVDGLSYTFCIRLRFIVFISLQT